VKGRGKGVKDIPGVVAGGEVEGLCAVGWPVSFVVEFTGVPYDLWWC
jgi:hypothetical protein